MSLCEAVIAMLESTELLWRYRAVDGSHLFTVHGEDLDPTYLVNGYLQFYVWEKGTDWKIHTIGSIEHYFLDSDSFKDWLTSIKKKTVQEACIDGAKYFGPKANQSLLNQTYEKGRKDDSSKLRWDLVPSGVLSQVVKVLTFGASKYSDDNWKKVPDQRRRYYAAMMRHIEAWWAGEKMDPESGVHHLAHAICCAMFLLWEDRDGAV